VLPGRGTLAKPFANNALNHTIGGVRGVYNRAEYAEQRREMLQAWADYIDRLAPSANLVV
jgi:hypothetical protein